jgi:hypothetical protein
MAVFQFQDGLFPSLFSVTSVCLVFLFDGMAWWR